MTETRDPMAPDGAVNPIDTDYKVGQDNIIVNVGPFGLDIHNRVFAISGLLVVAFVGVPFPASGKAQKGKNEQVEN